MQTSGLVSAIHSLDFSKPENTRFQYGSSACLLSIAAPIAGTCDEATPAMILAPFRPLFFGARFGFRLFRFRLGGRAFTVLRLAGFLGRRFGGGAGRLVEPARPAAIAFHRAAAGEHHVGVVFLRRAGHLGGEMPERMAVGGAEFCREIDVAAELQHAVVISLEHGLGLFRRQVELFQILRLVGLERLAVFVGHQRHAEHVDAVTLPRALLVEHESARNIVVIVLFAGHRRPPIWRAVLHRAGRQIFNASIYLAAVAIATRALAAAFATQWRPRAPRP